MAKLNAVRWERTSSSANGLAIAYQSSVNPHEPQRTLDETPQH